MPIPTVSDIIRRDKEEAIRIVDNLRRELDPYCDDHLTLKDLEEILTRNLSDAKSIKQDIRRIKVG